jgi:hypothetical protein
MNPLDEKSLSPEILDTVERLIRYYLLRRRNTVVQAMLELRPSLVIAFHVEWLVGIKDIPDYHRFYEENMEAKIRSSLSASGAMNGVFAYMDLDVN